MSIYLFSVAAFCACATLAVIEHAGQIPGALSGESLTNLSMYAIQQLDARDLLLERQSTCYSPNIYCPGMQHSRTTPNDTNQCDQLVVTAVMPSRTAVRADAHRQMRAHVVVLPAIAIQDSAAANNRAARPWMPNAAVMEATAQIHLCV